MSETVMTTPTKLTYIYWNRVVDNNMCWNRISNSRGMTTTSHNGYVSGLYFNGFLRLKSWDFASMLRLTDMSGTWDFASMLRLTDMRRTWDSGPGTHVNRLLVQGKKGELQQFMYSPLIICSLSLGLILVGCTFTLKIEMQDAEF